MVGEDDGGFITRLEVLCPLLKRPDNGKEFFIIDLIVALCGGQFMRVEGNQVEDSFMDSLRQDGGGDKIGGICL